MRDEAHACDTNHRPRGGTAKELSRYHFDGVIEMSTLLYLIMRLAIARRASKTCP
jgi:hypothetical protein